MMERRTLLKTLGAGVATVGATAPVTGSHSGDDTLRIGVLQPLSGGLGQFGRRALEGFYTGFGYFGADIPGEVSGDQAFTVGDLTVQTVVRDTEGQPDRARERAFELLTEADVDALVGGTLATSALRVAEIVAGGGIPYLAGPTGAPELTNGDSCSASVFRASEPWTATARAGGRYVAGESGANRVFIFHPEYTLGETLADTYQRLLERGGVTVVGRQAFPPGFANWQQPYQEAADAGAEMVVSAFSVSTLPRMLSAYLQNDYPFRFHASISTPLTLQTVGQIIADNLDSLTASAIEEAGIEPFSTLYHWNQFANGTADRATRIHRESYGRNPGVFTSGMFATASALVQAATETGSTNGDDIRGRLRGMTVETTMKGDGQYRFQEYNNQARSPVSVAPLVPRESSQQQYWEAAVRPGRPLRIYGMDQTTLGPSEVSCDLGSAPTAPTPDRDTPTPETPTPATATPPPETDTPLPRTETPTAEPPTPVSPTVTPRPSTPQTARPTEQPDGDTPTTAQPTATAANGNATDDGGLFSGTPAETGDLGPLVGLAGVLGGLGATWLAGRDGDEEE